jgi:casein kinase II subunit alpha
MKRAIVILLHAKGAFAVSRAYPSGCSKEPPSYYDYDSLEFPPSNIPVRTHDDFALLRRLGAGKFSDVFEAVEVSKDIPLRGNNHHAEFDPAALCVIKCLKPVSERKIKRELLVLSHVSKLPSLARLNAVVVPTIDQGEYPMSGKSQQIGSVYQYDGKMPSLVLEHAGRKARWLCHGLGCDPTSLSSSQKTEMQNQQEPYHLTEFEIKYYLCHLLVALDALHHRGIMHR